MQRGPCYLLAVIIVCVDGLAGELFSIHESFENELYDDLGGLDFATEVLPDDRGIEPRFRTNETRGMTDACGALQQFRIANLSRQER